MDFSDQLVPLNQSKTLPPSMFHHYEEKSYKLAQYYLYNYFKLISIISNKTSEGIPFTKNIFIFRPSFSVFATLALTRLLGLYLGLFHKTKLIKRLYKEAIQIQTCDKIM